MSDPLNVPFAEAMKTLMKRHKVTQRVLAERSKLSRAHISHISIGYVVPTVEVMEDIAKALEEKPGVFAEYRLAMARQRLDPQLEGLNRALKNLVDHGLDGGVEAHPAREMVRRRRRRRSGREESAGSP